MEQCKIDGCANLAEKGRRTNMCSAHRKRLAKGDLLQGVPVRAHYRTDPSRPISYKSAHGRVKHVRGAACQHACVDCGGTAKDWSYDHTDADALDAPAGRYSLDPSTYSPRCRDCHVKFDAAQRVVS